MEMALDKAIDIIVRNIQPDKIILFGSRARKDFRRESDYDICVVKEGIEHRRKLAQQIYKLLYGTGLLVDVIVETPETFDELKENPFLIYSEIARDGKVLYEKSGRS